MRPAHSSIVHHPAKAEVLGDGLKKLLPTRRPRQEEVFFVAVCLPSEFVPQRELYLASRAHDSKVPFGGTEITVRNAAIKRAKNVAIKGIWYINLKNDGLMLEYGCPFQYGKVFVEVALTSDIAQNQWSVAKNVPALGDKSRSIGIHERSTVEEVVRALRSEGPVGIFSAATIGNRGVE